MEEEDGKEFMKIEVVNMSRSDVIVHYESDKLWPSGLFNSFSFLVIHGPAPDCDHTGTLLLPELVYLGYVQEHGHLYGNQAVVQKFPLVQDGCLQSISCVTFVKIDRREFFL